jgi:Xaa-Pro aminopeptidase
VPVNKNLVDEVWTDRPAKPQEKVIVLSEKFSGQSIKEKLANLRETLEKKKAAGFVVSMLDEVMWLYNLRGSE